MFRIAPLALVLLTGLFASACGGGGPTTPPPPAPVTFAGEWHVFGYTPSTTNTRTLVGTLFAHVDGTIDTEVVAKTAAGDVVGPFPTVAELRYEMTPDRELKWFNAGVEATYEGGMGPQGEFAILGRVVADAPIIYILVRKGAALDPTALFGDYQEGLAYSGGGFIARSATMEDSGGPRSSFVNGVINHFGAVDARPLVGGATYSMLFDGTLEERSLAPVFNQGRPSADGNVIVWGGNLTPGVGVPTIGVRVRRSAGRTRADLQGEYFVVGVGRDDTTNLMRSETGTLTADGFGDAVMRRTVVEGGTLATWFNVSMPYGMTADGRLTVDLGSDGTFGGALSADGRVGVFSGSETTSSGGFYVLLKK